MYDESPADRDPAYPESDQQRTLGGTRGHEPVTG